MITLLLLHGTDCQPTGKNSYWYPSFTEEATDAGLIVTVPHLPTINHEPAADTIRELRKVYPDTPDILVTHSAGGPLALAMLQAGLIVKKTVMVARLP